MADFNLEEKILFPVRLTLCRIVVVMYKFITGLHANELGFILLHVACSPKEPELIDFGKIFGIDLVLFGYWVIVPSVPKRQLVAFICANKHDTPAFSLVDHTGLLHCDVSVFLAH